jgi:membrane protein YqaA with SNARE-associated domain
MSVYIQYCDGGQIFMVPIPERNTQPIIQTPSYTRLALTLCGLIILGVGCAFLARGHIESAGVWLIDSYGLWGISIATVITDTSPLPLTSEPIALLGLGADIPVWQIILFMGGTSHLCGPLGYAMGMLVGKIGLTKAMKRAALTPVVNYVRMYGVRAVAMGALLPIPYALTTWTAGALGVSFWGVLAASSLRWIKTAVYVSLIAGGWFFGTQ